MVLKKRLEKYCSIPCCLCSLSACCKFWFCLAVTCGHGAVNRTSGSSPKGSDCAERATKKWEEAVTFLVLSSSSIRYFQTVLVPSAYVRN